MIEIFTALAFELTSKILVGTFLFKVDPNLAYAYAVHEGYRYYQAIERALAFRKTMKSLNAKKLGEGVYKVDSDEKSDDN